MKGYAVIFMTVLMAELGDKTQLATLLFAANPTLSRVGVFVAAAAALSVSTLLAVVLGERLGAWIPAEHLKLIGAVGFLAIGVWMLVTR